MSMVAFKSAPLLGPRFALAELLEPNPPPKKEEKISPKSPKSSNPEVL